VFLFLLLPIFLIGSDFSRTSSGIDAKVRLVTNDGVAFILAINIAFVTPVLLRLTVQKHACQYHQGHSDSNTSTPRNLYHVCCCHAKPDRLTFRSQGKASRSFDTITKAKSRDSPWHGTFLALSCDRRRTHMCLAAFAALCTARQAISCMPRDMDDQAEYVHKLWILLLRIV